MSSIGGGCGVDKCKFDGVQLREGKGGRRRPCKTVEEETSGKREEDEGRKHEVKENKDTVKYDSNKKKGKGE